MVELNEAALTRARILELYERPVAGDFDVAHLREVHRRIFQDLPHHGPGEFRPDAPGHFKNRGLEAASAHILVSYALRPETDRLLGPTLDALQGGKALNGLNLREMSGAIAETYARLDYLHPFREGNSRTLRTFTEQLARENGHKLDWGTTNVTPQSRDALYIARDIAVIQQRYPGLTADQMMTVEDREKYEMAVQLHDYRLADPLQEIVRRSLERGRDAEPYDRRMSVTETVHEIRAVADTAARQAERKAEATRIDVLRRKAPESAHEKAAALHEWVRQEGNLERLSDRLAYIASDHITIRHDPGAPAIERLGAIAQGIDRELVQERSPTEPIRPIARDDMER